MAAEAVSAPYNSQDPTATFLNSSCLDLLLIELVPTVQQLSATSATSDSGTAFKDDSSTKPVDEDEAREAAAQRLEAVGYRVGQGLAERFSRDRARFADTLDVIKFVCKDVWMLVFRKQVDNLKTNHRGVYVLTDSSFRPFARMSTQSLTDATAKAAPFLSFPCGVVRGALSAMGITATVQAETAELPAAVFQVKTIIGGRS